jgi:hypothetical protein
LIALAGHDAAKVTSPVIAAALDALYGVPARTREDLARWEVVSEQPWPKRRARRIVACIGRRGLKTTGLGAWIILYEALCRSWGYARFALPGSRLRFPVVCPFVPQSAEALSAVKGAIGMLAPLGIAADVRDEQGAPSITIRNPRGPCEVIINCFTANEFSVVGFTVPFHWEDEAARFMPTGPSSLRSVARQLGPAGSTFSEPGCDAGSLWTSNKNVSEGAYFDAVEGPPKPGTCLVRAASWESNPRVSRSHCLALCDGDERELAVTYDGKSKLWGYDGEGYVQTAKIVLGGWADQSARRPGSRVLGLDVGQIQDSSGFVVVSAAETDVSPDATPVRSIVVEHVEMLAASKANPPAVEEIVGRACDIASSFGDCPITCDFFCGVEVRRALEKRGWTQYLGEFYPSSRQYVIVGMGPNKQGPRWNLIRSLAAGGRLHVVDSAAGRALVQQLGHLVAKTLPTGGLKIEGRQSADDLADALAVAAEIGMKIPASSGDGGATEYRNDGISWNGHDLTIVGERWVRTMPDGREVSAPCPEWDFRFGEIAAMQLGRGIRTAANERWLSKQPPEIQACYALPPLAPSTAPQSLNVRIG